MKTSNKKAKILFKAEDSFPGLDTKDNRLIVNLD